MTEKFSLRRTGWGIKGLAGLRSISVWMLLALAALLLLCLPACAAGEEEAYWPAEEWRTSTPEKQGMDSGRLEEMMALIDEKDIHYDSVLVVKDGHLVFEEYRNGYDEDRKHHLQSTTKSISSLLIGTLFQRGLLESVDQKMVDLFGDYEIENMDERKQAITLEHLLTMTDGMDWHERDYPYEDPNNSLGQMWQSSDALQHILDTPMREEPGQTWSYNSGTSMLLGGIIEGLTGEDLLKYSREALFTPLGIESLRWDSTKSGHYHTDGGLYLTPRDMARIGYLALREGNWNGEQIVPAEWIEQSTQDYLPDDDTGYGYQWWTLPGGVFTTRGHYEQLIYVVPETDMVVVFTGYVPDESLHITDGLLYDYILAAVDDLPEELQHATYDDYGITFDYPVGATLSARPFEGEDVISSEAGQFLLQHASHPFEIMQVMWTAIENSEEEMTVTDILTDMGFDGMVGDPWTGSFGEHEASFQLIEYEEAGIPLSGIASAWYCEESGRAFMAFYLTNPDFSAEEIKDNYQALISGLDCHAGEE